MNCELSQRIQKNIYFTVVFDDKEQLSCWNLWDYCWVSML